MENKKFKLDFNSIALFLLALYSLFFPIISPNSGVYIIILTTALFVGLLFLSIIQPWRKDGEEMKDDL